MPRVDIINRVDIVNSPRVMQASGMFDIQPGIHSTSKFVVDFDLPDDWDIGVIVGPSGAGKSTLINRLWPSAIAGDFQWPRDKSVLDGFPARMGIREIVRLLSSVGFSSPPAWVRPFRTLSNGEQFRANMARVLADERDLVVVDEFTSVVDRTVAKVSSSAIQKAVRRSNKRLIVCSCHYDILDWLEPDWVYQPATAEFYTGRYLHRRPAIELKIRRVGGESWGVFRRYHYMSKALNRAARCFTAFWNDIPVAFVAVLHFPHPKNKRVKREHRLVCLPDYQGCGIGSALSMYVAGMCRALGFDYLSQTAHPGVIAHRIRDARWRVNTCPRIGKKNGNGSASTWKSLVTRNVYGFRYVGAAIDKAEAQRLWNAPLAPARVSSMRSI